MKEHGDGGDGYVVDVGDIMKLADTCYDIAQLYTTVTNKIVRTDDALPHLTDGDGVATAGDLDVTALVDEFSEYLTTTAARYYLAGEKLEKTAAAYAERENLTISGFGDLGDYELNWDPSTLADDTDRPDGANEAPATDFPTDETPAAEGGSTAFLEGLDGDEGRD